MEKSHEVGAVVVGAGARQSRDSFHMMPPWPASTAYRGEAAHDRGDVAGRTLDSLA